MRAHPTEQLSEYVDGELAAPERRAVEDHLAACADCAATVDELRRVVARAQALDDRPPASDLWPGIADRIGVGRPQGASAARQMRPGRPVRRFVFTVPQLAAAAATLVVTSAALVVALLSRAPGTGGAATEPAAMAIGWPNAPRIDAAVARLELALAQGRGVLDTATIRVLERSLQLIDNAIVDARRALERDPGNAYLNHHLAQQTRRKLELLRRANGLIAARS